MRCVQRGEPPLNEQGEPLVFSRYQDAAPHLKERLGRYCSFCERWIATSLAVEHKHPKSKAAHLALSWSNFLLACSNCNSAKGIQVVDDADVLWPDVDNTFSALEYLPSGRVRPAEAASGRIRQRAERLLKLAGLDRRPGESPSDHRWLDRLEVWRLAEQSLEDMAQTPTAQMALRIANFAAARGGFSIWMQAFRGMPEVQQALIARFPGTVLRESPESTE